MKAFAQIEYENGILRIDAVVNGRVVHHRADFTADVPTLQRRVESYLVDAMALVPTFAWHELGSACTQCHVLETQKGTRHA